MTPHTAVDEALSRVDQAERHYRQAFFAAVGVEAAMLPLYLALADLGNRTHVLLLIAMVATYTIVGLGLLALGAHVNRNTQRILRALQLAAEARPSS
jgi:hypothetical protein